LGLEPVSPKELTGGTPEDNASIIQDILRGKRNPKREIVLINAAPAFVACGQSKTLKEGYEEAGRSVDSGAACEKLEKLVQFTKQFAS
ncbi:MAG: hypothetical protein MI861_05530, partial [Pirellulales bacterium]|nr:hypothetical protein [Pirellulales bacterium]